jgi:hypothetical protein
MVNSGKHREIKNILEISQTFQVFSDTFIRKNFKRSFVVCFSDLFLPYHVAALIG